MEVGGVGLAKLEERFVAVHPMYAVVDAEERPPRSPRPDTALVHVTEGLGKVVPQIFTCQSKDDLDITAGSGQDVCDGA